MSDDEKARGDPAAGLAPLAGFIALATGFIFMILFGFRLVYDALGAVIG